MSCAGTFSYIFFFRERVSRMKGGFMNQKQKTMLKRIVAAAIVYIAAAAAKICRNAAAVDRVSRIFNSVSDYWMGYCIQGVPGD